MASLYDLGLNMTDIRSNEGIESLPRGRFSFEIARFEEAETSAEAKNPGALMYKVGLKCTGPDQYSGKWVFDQIVLAGPRLRDNMGRLRALLEAAGIPTEEIDDQKFRPTTEWGQINLIGRTVDADVYPTPATDQYRAGNGVSAYYSHEFGDAELL
jgi:cellobiose-specific phosphotransferase system component IIB